MLIEELQPFLGRDCNAVVRCRACGREHTLNGRLTAGATRGDLLLSGCSYSPDDFVSISSSCEERRPSLSALSSWMLPYLGVAAALVTWLHAARR